MLASGNHPFLFFVDAAAAEIIYHSGLNPTFSGARQLRHVTAARTLNPAFPRGGES